MLLLLFLLLLVDDLFIIFKTLLKKKNAMASVTYVAQTRLSVLLSVIYASRASQVLFNVLSLHTLLIIWHHLSMCVFIKCAHRLLFTYMLCFRYYRNYNILFTRFYFYIPSFFSWQGKISEERDNKVKHQIYHAHVIVSVYAMNNRTTVHTVDKICLFFCTFHLIWTRHSHLFFSLFPSLSLSFSLFPSLKYQQ